VNDDLTTLSVSAGIGGVWEKDYTLDLRTPGALSVDGKFTHELSASASVSRTFSALWNISDAGDGSRDVRLFRKF
jgi:hypothetical protein